jgi:hypothetical protein
MAAVSNGDGTRGLLFFPCELKSVNFWKKKKAENLDEKRCSYGSGGGKGKIDLLWFRLREKIKIV